MWRRRGPTEDEIARELRDHLELEGRELQSPTLARRGFGNPTYIGESVREVWHWTWVEQLLQDTRYGLRSLRRSPAYALAVIVTLALGIGATTLVFSLTDAILARPFPLLPQGDLVWFQYRSRTCPRCDNASPAAFGALQGARTLSGIAATTHWRVPLRVGGAGSELVEGYRVSPTLFQTISAPFALGRGFRADDATPNGASVAVLSYALWRSRLGASRGVLDSTILLAGNPYRVVGVLAEHMIFPAAADVYTPLILSSGDLTDNSSRYLDLFGRLAPNATLADARREGAVISARLDAQSRLTERGWSAVPRPLKEFHTDDPGLFIDMAMISALLVLLAATVSVANLALARATVRRHELTLRAALGGRRGRLMRHLLIEGLLLSLVGSAFGVAFALWGTRATRGAIPASLLNYMPGSAFIRVDARALLFTLGTALVVTVLFALLPALRATGAKLSAVLAEGGRTAAGGAHGTRIRAAIVIAEVSVALALLTCATLMSSSVRNMLGADPGVRRDHVLTMHLSMARGLSDSAARSFIRRTDAELHALPGVRGAAFVSTTPLSNNSWGTHFEIAGRAPGTQPLEAIDQRVTYDYFQTAGVRVRSGRALEARDDAEGAPRTVVINHLMKERFWPTTDPVGSVLLIDSLPWTIVGVATDVRHRGFEEALEHTLYRSALVAVPRSCDVNVWTAGDPSAMRDPVRRAIAAIDPDAAVGELLTMQELEARHVSAFKVMAAGLTIFAAITVVIAVVGLYGIIAYGVAQRRREIGIRMALGASARRIVRDITAGGVRLTIAGIALGGVSGVALAQLLQSVLYGVSATDPRTPLAVAAILLVVTLLATLIPAWRALSVDPATVLRET
jgi:predicted permease